MALWLCNLNIKLGLLFTHLNIWQHILFSFGFSRLLKPDAGTNLTLTKCGIQA